MVSILVFVEATFRHEITKMVSYLKSFRFNPCFRGSYFSTQKRGIQMAEVVTVSILVFVEATFRPLWKKKTYFSGEEGFNPCFRGSYFSTIELLLKGRKSICFNPCFRGSYFSTPEMYSECANWSQVSILVFVEATFRLVLPRHG